MRLQQGQDHQVLRGFAESAERFFRGLARLQRGLQVARNGGGPLGLVGSLPPPVRLGRVDFDEPWRAHAARRDQRVDPVDIHL